MKNQRVKQREISLSLSTFFSFFFLVFLGGGGGGGGGVCKRAVYSDNGDA